MVNPLSKQGKLLLARNYVYVCKRKRLELTIRTLSEKLLAYFLYTNCSVSEGLRQYPIKDKIHFRDLRPCWWQEIGLNTFSYQCVCTIPAMEVHMCQVAGQAILC